MRRKKHQTKSRPNAPGEEQLLELLEQIIFNLNEKNFDASIESITNLYKSEPDSPYSLNLVLCKLIYSSFVSSLKKPGLFINFIVSLMSKEENDQLISILSKYLLKLESQESYYLLEKMIKRGLIEQYFIKNKRTLYFSHYKTKKQIDELISSNPFDTFFVKNIDNISKNDWELHKQLIKEGHNPNEIAKIIRNDEIEKLQEISSQKDFDFNQTIEPSLYERCSFINQENVSLIDYAAFFSAVKCFKYLIMNNANVENTCKFAVAGGNEEIIQSCEKNNSSLSEVYETAIEFHRNDVFHYFYDKHIEIKDFTALGMKCIQHSNYILFKYLEEEKMKINSKLIQESAKNGNFFLTKYLIQNNHVPNVILSYSAESDNIELFKFLFEHKGVSVKEKNDFCGQNAIRTACKKGYFEVLKYIFQSENINDQEETWDSTALTIASKKGNYEIVKFLLGQEGIDVNLKDYVNKTALFLAAEKGHTKIVKLLLKQKDIIINPKDDFYDTPLTIACKNNHNEVVKLLVQEKEIKLNNQNRDYDTALIIAVKNGNMELVKLLATQKGIDLNLKNIERKTAIKIAFDKGYTEIVQFLRSQKGIEIYNAMFSMD